MKTKIIILISLLFISCGSRKVQRSENKITETAQLQTTKVDSSKTTTESNSNVKIVDSSTTEETTVQAQDTSKPFFVKGVKYKNAILKHKKVKNNITTDKAEKVSQIKQNSVKEDVKANINKQSKENTVDIDRKQYDWTKTIIVISIILGLVFWFIYFFYYRKKKNNPSN